MTDPSKTIQDLTEENAALKKRIDELKAADAETKLRDAYEQLRAADEQMRAQYHSLVESERSLRESEGKYRRLTETAHDLIVSVDLNWKITYVNQATLAIAGGMNPVGMNFLDFTPPHLHELQEALMKKRREGFSDMLAFEWEIHLPTGKDAIFEVRATLINEDEKPSGVLFVARDITERKLAEAAMRASEERFHELFERAPLGYQSLDSDGRFIEVNFAWLETLGYKREEVVGKWFGDFLAPEYIQAFRARFPVFKAQGEVHTQFSMMHKDGSRRYIAFDGRIGHNADGSFKQTHCILKDVTELKKTEEALRLSEELLSRAQEISHSGSWILDLTANRLTWSDEAYRIFGCEPQEFAATYEAFLDLVHPDDRAAVDEAYSRSLREGSDGYEIRHRVVRRKSGEVRYVHERCVHERDDAGAIIQSTGIVQDITEHKQSAEALKNSEYLLNKIFDVLPIGLWFADENGRLIRGNPAGVKIWGAEPTVPMDEYGVFKARRLPSGKEIAPDDWALAHTIREGVTIVDELLEIEAFDGQKKIILNYTAPVLDNEGNIQGAIVVNHDISERERLQAQLLQAQKMESVGRLAGGVAHDFNNMLGVIFGHTEMAMEQVDPALPLYADLQEIRKAAERSSDLTRQLLAFARKQTVSPKVIDLNKAIEGMLKMLRRLIGEDIQLAWLPGANTWPVKMDPSQIDQILANLCVNARDAIAGVGKVTIETRNVAFDDAYCTDQAGSVPGDYVLLALSDDGCGMDQETLFHLFEPFFTTKDVGKGTGLGLATVYGIVKQNNGFIDVDSEPDQGTTFKIYLPRHIGKTRQEQAEGPQEPVMPGHETLLVVEDEKGLLDLCRRILEKLGYQVLTASTPGEAIKLAEEHTGDIHLLMTDVIMPEMNGRELARALLSLYPKMKRLFMSGYTADVIAHHGVLDDGVHFIQKPFTGKKLSTKVRDMLDSE